MNLMDIARVWLRGRTERGEITRATELVELSRLRSLVNVHGDRPVCALNRATLLAWQARVGRQAPSSRRACLSTVRKFCSWLTTEGHLPADPTAGLGRVREPRRVPRALPAGDVTRLLDTCPTARARAIVALMVGCGLRCVEVSRLDLGDYDPAVRLLVVRGKAGHERVLPVPAETGEALDRYLRVRGGQAGPLVVPLPQGKWSPTGRVSASRISALVARLMADAGLHRPGDGRTAHALRHTAASDVLDACRDLRLVQQMLGHTSLQATQIYLRRADLGQLRTAMEGRRYAA